MAKVTDYQKNVRSVLEGNERVYFHPHRERLAIWYGRRRVSIVSSRSWEEIDEFFLKGPSDIESLESQLVVQLASMGYDRRGRSEISTRVSEI